MSKIRFIGCLHFGDEYIATNNRKFASSKEHDEHLIKQWNETVADDDVVYILGDISMEDAKHYHKLGSLKGLKFVVMGNHDLPDDSKKLMGYVDGLCGMRYLELPHLLGKISVWVSHAPLHPQELSFVDYNIHAHIHEMKIPFTDVSAEYWGQFASIISKQGIGYINVDAHMIDYKPKTIEELLINNKKVIKTIF